MMANEQNLKKGKNTQFDKLTSEKLARIAQKGRAKIRRSKKKKKSNERTNGNAINTTIKKRKIKKAITRNRNK